MTVKKTPLITFISTIIAVVSPFVIAGWTLVYKPVDARISKLEQRCDAGEKSRQMIIEILLLMAKEAGVDTKAIIERDR